jgi:hypothetical protein
MFSARMNGDTADAGGPCRRHFRTAITSTGRILQSDRSGRTAVFGRSAHAARAAHGVAGALSRSAASAPALDGSAAVVTFIGHATFLIQTAAGNILTDPMFSERASPLRMAGPRRVRQPALRFDRLPPISTVLLSHNHYDHCDLPTLRALAERFDPIVIDAVGNERSCGLPGSAASRSSTGGRKRRRRRGRSR